MVNFTYTFFFTGLLVSFNILFINAAFDVINFFSLKMKLENNEYSQIIERVNVIKNKGKLSRCLSFFTTFDSVKVYEVNGKKLKSPIRASLDHKWQKDEKTGSLIKLPLGHFYIPETKEGKSKEVSKVA